MLVLDLMEVRKIKYNKMKYIIKENKKKILRLPYDPAAMPSMQFSTNCVACLREIFAKLSGTINNK